MLAKMGILQGILLLGWMIVGISFVVLLGKTSKKPLDDSANKLDPLKVYGSERDSYAEVNREKATEFSLEKVASVVNYLLLAAAAVLSFTVKSIVDLRSELAKSAATGGVAPAPPAARPSRTQLLCLLHGGIGCFLSLVCGVAAYLFLPSVGTYKDFSIYNEVQICVLFQIVLLIAALGCLLIALVCVVLDLLP
jgi:hypothetical protein